MIPTPYTVQHYAHTTDGVDAHNNPIVAWDPPLDGPGEERAVAGWSTAGSAEPAVAGHDRVVVDVELLVPKGFPARAQDRIRLLEYPEGLYEIVGDPKDFTHSPFPGPLGRGWGYTLNLRKVEG